MNNRRPNIKVVFLLLILFMPFRVSALMGSFMREFQEQKAVDTIVNQDQLKIFPFSLDIVAPSAGIQFFRDNIIFLSNTKDEHRMSRTQISFGTTEMYTAAINDTSTLQHVLFTPLSSFSCPADGVTFSNDYTTLYFTMIPRKGKREQIYKGSISTTKENVVAITADQAPLAFCNAGYSYSHPSLSSDGNIIVFASDMPGTTGGMDLYITRRTGETWSEPANLGIDINSAKNEFWPFLDEFNNLYFSSDRFGGLGGYDIYTSKYNGTGWNKPVLLDKNINSQDDDIALVINRDNGKTAFFSRRMKNSKGSIQLFRIMTGDNKTAGASSSIAEYFNGVAIKTANISAQQEVVIKKDAPVSPTIQPVITKNEDITVKPDAVTEKKTEPLRGKENTKVSENLKKEVTVKADTVSSLSKQTETGNIFTSERVPEKVNENVSKGTTKVIEQPKKQEIDLNKRQEVRPDTLTKVSKKPEIEKVVADSKNTDKQNTDVAVKSESKAQVIYKVQLLPVAADRKAGKMSINGVDYKISDYMYLGAERYTIGEFSKLQDAVKLLRNCRQGGYDQSFVVAFRGNVRALEPELFK